MDVHTLSADGPGPEASEVGDMLAGGAGAAPEARSAPPLPIILYCIVLHDIIHCIVSYYIVSYYIT